VAAPPLRSGENQLGGALEALFEPGALDDHVAVAEALLHSGGAILVPETSDFLLDLGMLGGDGRVVPLGEDVQQLGTPIRGALDLELDVV
jgi:hypothetical protein